MNRFVKVAGLTAAGMAMLVGLNWTKIQRLNNVNSLFDADKIVQNFSNMDGAFLHHDLTISGEPFIWPEALEPLPETVTINGKDWNLAEVLETLDTTALVVIKDGKMVHESYYKGTDRDDRRISWSVAKSFMSGLYGNALSIGQVKSLDDTVESYVPSLIGSAYEGATIRNVLNMASGIKFDENYMDANSDINDMGRVLGLGGSMDKYASELTEIEAMAGERWKYVSIDTHVAAMVLRAATGKSLHELFEQTYGANLGFEIPPFYMTDGKDVAFALGGLNLATRDYAKFGQLFLDGGQFNGKQVVPANWVAESTVHSAPNLNGRGTGYGYQWWVPMPQEGPNAGDFFAVGIYGQYIYINPRAGLVIAKNAADREFAYPMPEFGETFGHSMNVNVAMFRSMADYYAGE
ncbi:serine hydrolase domain-containing protein [Fretibacter rubidus]|uniref:serine hydrolase domain-containing protein n=1 Tax=Fretibacter rubidus TaxID=570162 RepID=UPI00352B0519